MGKFYCIEIKAKNRKYGQNNLKRPKLGEKSKISPELENKAENRK